jgi:hypothetical protein
VYLPISLQFTCPSPCLLASLPVIYRDYNKYVFIKDVENNSRLIVINCNILVYILSRPIKSTIIKYFLSCL